MVLGGFGTVLEGAQNRFSILWPQAGYGDTQIWAGRSTSNAYRGPIRGNPGAGPGQAYIQDIPVAQLYLTGYLKAIWPDLCGCVFEVRPAQNHVSKTQVYTILYHTILYHTFV